MANAHDQSLSKERYLGLFERIENDRVVWLRIEILPTHVAWRPASPSSKGSNPPEIYQSGSEQFEDVAGGVDVRFQKLALHRLLVQRKMFRGNWSTTFMLASLAGAPDEGQFDTALSQSAWIRAPLGQARLVLVLAAPGADAWRVRPVR
jgi:hypothetical protein